MQRTPTDGRPAAPFARGSRRARAFLGLLVATAAAVLPIAVVPGAAVASAGSVPVEVSGFVADGLLAQLDEYFGPAKDGTGIAFDETTEFGAVHRVFSWTHDFLAGADVEHPVEMLNEWITVVSLQGAAIGVATISIEPSTVKPELVDFRRSAVLAAALREIPETASLVREDATSAWFALADQQIVPLVPGSSGVAAATSLENYQRGLSQDVAADEPQFGPGFVLPAVAIGAIVVLLVIFLLLPGRRREVEDSAEEGSAEDGRAEETDAEKTNPEATAAEETGASEASELGADQLADVGETTPATPAVSAPAAVVAEDATPPKKSVAPKRPAAAKKTSAAKKPAAVEESATKTSATKAAAAKTPAATSSAPKTPAMKTPAVKAPAKRAPAAKTLAAKPTPAAKTPAAKAPAPKASAAKPTVTKPTPAKRPAPPRD